MMQNERSLSRFPRRYWYRDSDLVECSCFHDNDVSQKPERFGIQEIFLAAIECYIFTECGKAHVATRRRLIEEKAIHMGWIKITHHEEAGYLEIETDDVGERLRDLRDSIGELVFDRRSDARKETIVIRDRDEVQFAGVAREFAAQLLPDRQRRWRKLLHMLTRPKTASNLLERAPLSVIEERVSQYGVVV